MARPPHGHPDHTQYHCEEETIERLQEMDATLHDLIKAAEAHHASLPIYKDDRAREAGVLWEKFAMMCGTVASIEGELIANEIERYLESN